MLISFVMGEMKVHSHGCPRLDEEDGGGFLL